MRMADIVAEMLSLAADITFCHGLYTSLLDLLDSDLYKALCGTYRNETYFNRSIHDLQEFFLIALITQIRYNQT